MQKIPSLTFENNNQTTIRFVSDNLRASAEFLEMVSTRKDDSSFSSACRNLLRHALLTFQLGRVPCKCLGLARRIRLAAMRLWKAVGGAKFPLTIAAIANDHRNSPGATLATTGGLCTSPKPQDQVKGALLLDIVVCQGPAILELFASENQALLIRRDSLLVLDLALDHVDSIRALNLERDSFASKSLDKNLHSTPQPQNKMQGALLLDIVVCQGPAILKLFASENQALLIRRNPLLVLNLALDHIDSIRALHLKGDGLSSQLQTNKSVHDKSDRRKSI